MPLEVHVAIMKGLRHLCLSFNRVLSAKDECNAGFCEKEAETEEVVEGSHKGDFPELVGPTSIGTRVVLAGPRSTMFRKATASSLRHKEAALALKKALAAAE